MSNRDKKTEKILGYPDIDENFFKGKIPENKPKWDELDRKNLTIRYNSTVKYVKDIEDYETVKITYVHCTKALAENENPRRCIFFHGFNCVPESYSLFLNELCKEFEVLTYDNFAHGETSAPSSSISRDEAYTATSAIKLARRVLEHEGWLEPEAPKFYVVGHSMGGEMALICQADDIVSKKTLKLFSFTPAGMHIITPALEGAARSCLSNFIWKNNKKTIYKTINSLMYKNNFPFFPQELIDYHTLLGDYYMGSFNDKTSEKFVERVFFMSKHNTMRAHAEVAQGIDNMEKNGVDYTVLLIENDKYINSKKSRAFLEEKAKNCHLIWRKSEEKLNHDICILHPSMAIGCLRDAFGFTKTESIVKVSVENTNDDQEEEKVEKVEVKEEEKEIVIDDNKLVKEVEELKSVEPIPKIEIEEKIENVEHVELVEEKEDNDIKNVENEN